MEIERNELCNIIEQHKIKIVNYFGTEELSEILKLNYDIYKKKYSILETQRVELFTSCGNEKRNELLEIDVFFF